MKSSDLQLCVECSEVFGLGAAECPSCTCAQAIPLDKIINRRPTAILPVCSAEAAALHARASFKAIDPRAWQGGER